MSIHCASGLHGFSAIYVGSPCVCGLYHLNQTDVAEALTFGGSSTFYKRDVLVQRWPQRVTR